MPCRKERRSHGQHHAIQLRLVAAPVERASRAEGSIFLGLAGREFRVSDGQSAFDRGDGHTYLYGDGASVLDPEFNDPRHPQLDTINLNKFPTYIRFEPRSQNDRWRLSVVEVIVRSPEADEIYIEIGPVGSGPIWLGQGCGKIVYLWPPEPLSRTTATSPETGRREPPARNPALQG
ncbi:hypothetical protein SLNSH_23875 [Alsobacter soli]|uniref:Uncharacterized protein n=2 Tax=Alsobacter soli TaxID=2109933 RepID=A0A2T1HLL2_9HYPH|nr:hypothetical protein SLNSH_23875 [Alsobacter soli]